MEVTTAAKKTNFHSELKLKDWGILKILKERERERERQRDRERFNCQDNETVKPLYQ